MASKILIYGTGFATILTIVTGSIQVLEFFDKDQIPEINANLAFEISETSITENTLFFKSLAENIDKKIKLSLSIFINEITILEQIDKLRECESQTPFYPQYNDDISIFWSRQHETNEPAGASDICDHDFAFSYEGLQIRHSDSIPSFFSRFVQGGAGKGTQKYQGYFLVRNTITGGFSHYHLTPVPAP